MPQSRSSKLRVIRGSQYADALRAYRILVDGKTVGKVSQANVLEVEIAPGPHRLEARLDWGRSAPLEFQAKAGETVEVEVSNRWGALLALWAITFGFRSYLLLKPRDARHRLDGQSA